MTIGEILKVFFISASLVWMLTQYLILLLVPARRYEKPTAWPSLSILIPCHNEEGIIEECVRSAFAARYAGERDVTVIDDASADKSPAILQALCTEFPSLRVITHPAQGGKSNSLNSGIAQATGELIAVMDGDSVIAPDALEEMVQRFGAPDVGACGAAIRVHNLGHVLTWWVHLDLLVFSLTRMLMTRINANITIPGPLGMYRAVALKGIGGFNPRGFSEDADILIRLIRAGWRSEFAEKAVAATVMPYRFMDIMRQYYRWMRGLTFLLRLHLRYRGKLIDCFTLPLQCCNYIQAIVVGPQIIWTMIVAWHQQFFIDGNAFTFMNNAIFFTNWATVVGFVQYAYKTVSQMPPEAHLSDYMGIVNFSLVLGMSVLAVAKFEKRLRLIHLVPFFLSSPRWWCLTVVTLLSACSIFVRDQKNMWEKRSTYSHGQNIRKDRAK